jgi:alpha-ribazole phosphatase
MTVTTRWWWVRHAPVINPDQTIYGQMDLAADFSDAARLDALAALLPADAHWVTTSLRRARGTAAEIASRLSPPPAVTEDDSLREQHFGEWEGARWAEIAEDISRAYWDNPVENRMPGGESFADVAARVRATVETLTEAHGGRDIVAVAHAGSIRAAIAHALGGDARPGLSFRLAPLSLTRIDAIRRDEETWWRVSGVNLYGEHD